jgi:hypothetical protein
MTFSWFRLPIVLAILMGFLLIGCGGGGEGTQSTGAGTNTQILMWDPPQTYVDNTAMDPYRELDYYEFYVSSDSNFTDNEMPVAQVAAVTNVLLPDGKSYRQDLTSEFALTNLLPFTEPNSVYYISIRSVAVGGLKSNFSAPIVWNLT